MSYAAFEGSAEPFICTNCSEEFKNDETVLVVCRTTIHHHPGGINSDFEDDPPTQWSSSFDDLDPIEYYHGKCFNSLIQTDKG